MIYVVGIGSGNIETITPQAMEVLKSCDVIAGYSLYIDMVRDLLPGKILYSSGMTHEIDRCNMAMKFAVEYGKNVALISSGDPGVYGMAGLMMEIASGSGVEVRIIPGITAANSCSSILGAPLMNDYVTISLSDRMTEWRVIERRLIGACIGDFVICLYNPASIHRPNNLKRACDIILNWREPETIAGYVRNAGRYKETYDIMTLRKLRNLRNIDMLCTVIIGNSKTYILDGKMITPRGYKLG